MGKVCADQTMSLDGFSTRPDVAVGTGMWAGGDKLHEWMAREDGGPASSTAPASRTSPPNGRIGRVVCRFSLRAISRIVAAW